MKFNLNPVLAAVAVSAVALPGLALAQYAPPPPPGYRWGPPPAAAYEDEQVVVRPRQIPAEQGRPYGPTVIQAPGPVPPGYRQPETRMVPGSAEFEQAPPPRPPSAVGPAGPQAAPPPAATASAPPAGASALPPEDQPEIGEPKQLPPQFQRQLVDYPTREPAGTLIIDTPNTYLYLVLGDGKALRYGIGVGREGFTWTGAERVSRMAEWPDWHPPAEMIERQPYLPRFMAGGEGNPLGARALYLGKTLYRIHGTNQPSTIGSFVSSGCIRLTNRDIEDLYSRVQVGMRVVVLPGGKAAETASAAPAGYQGPVQQGPQQIVPPGASSGAGPVSIAGPNSIPASGLPPAR